MWYLLAICLSAHLVGPNSTILWYLSAHLVIPIHQSCGMYLSNHLVVPIYSSRGLYRWYLSILWCLSSHLVVPIHPSCDIYLPISSCGTYLPILRYLSTHPVGGGHPPCRIQTPCGSTFINAREIYFNVPSGGVSRCRSMRLSIDYIHTSTPS